MFVQRRSSKPSTRAFQAALRTLALSAAEGVAATLTLKRHVGGRRICERQASECIRKLLRRLDRRAYRSGARHLGLKVNAIAVREGSSDERYKHLHYHLIIQVPRGYTPECWASVVLKEWLDCQWAGEQNCVKPTWDVGFLDYMLKDWDKPNFLDAMDFENWRLPGAR